MPAGDGDPDALITLVEGEVARLLQVADLVTQARIAVERDAQGNPIYAHDQRCPPGSPSS
ncbi:MAG: hypothetical protein M3186_05885 [Actinomycetota bacterium]|nr:hypothetical protein [Actinomycetota bacterium]